MSNIISIQGYELHIQDNKPMVRDLDLAERLGFVRPRKIRELIKRLIDSGSIKDDQVRPTVGRLKNKQEVTEFFLSEKAVLKVITKSETEKADQITDEMIDVFIDYRNDNLQPALNPADLSRFDILKIAMKSEEENQRLTQQVEEMVPKVEALERIAKADGSMCITDVAKDLQMRPKDLFAWLSFNKWIYKRAGGAGWVGYQDKLQQGVLEHKVTVVSRTDGSEKVTEQVRVTSKGLTTLAKLINKNAA